MKQQKTMVLAQVCGTCSHYYQHYVLIENQFKPIWYGHCYQSRSKNSAPDQTCPNWKVRKEETASES